MCFIIMSIKKSKRDKKNVSDFIGNTYVAFLNNSDMEGLYVSATNSIYKSKAKQSFEGLEDVMAESNVLLYHARLSTSGFGFKNCQPIKLGNYVFLHNGIFNINPPARKSDSVCFFEEMYKNILELNNVKDAFKETYKKLIKNEFYNSYSLAIYDIENKLLHYIKNGVTNILMYKNSDEIILSTSKIATQMDYTMLEPYIFYTIDSDLNIYQERMFNVNINVVSERY